MAIYAIPSRELVMLLRQGHGARKPRTRGTDRRGALQDMVSIHARLPEANDRLLPGHWEGDHIKGAANRSAVGTLVCHKTLFMMIVKSLIRQYLPKGIDLSIYSQRQFDQVAWSLNPQPRKTLGFRTPADVLLEDCYDQSLKIQTGVALGL